MAKRLGVFFAASAAETQADVTPANSLVVAHEPDDATQLFFFVAGKRVEGFKLPYVARGKGGTVIGAEEKRFDFQVGGKPVWFGGVWTHTYPGVPPLIPDHAGVVWTYVEWDEVSGKLTFLGAN